MFGFGIAEQTRTFILAFGFGFLLGIVYDVLRVIRMIFSDSKKLVAVQDIFFSLITIFTTFNFFLIVNKGEFRGYLFFSIAMGFLLYRFSFGTFVIFLCNKIIALIKSIIKALLFPFRIICRPIKSLVKFLVKKLRKIKKILKLHLKNASEVLYNKLRFGFSQKKIGKNENGKYKNSEKV